MKRWFISFIGCFILLIMSLAGITILVDPYFHYHKPIKGLQYDLYDERYQNNGILRNFEYDSIITGSSMTQNFNASLFDTLFEARTIKIPFSGGTFKEINDNLESAYSYNNNIKYIVRSIDYNMFPDDSDKMYYTSYPSYLYDDYLINDIKYIFNKTVLLDAVYKHVFLYTLNGGITTSFDDYKNWNDAYAFGKEAVIESYNAREPHTEEFYLNRENFTENVVQLVEEHPETQFYFFFPPYSILWYYEKIENNQLDNYFQSEEEAIKLLVPYSNVHLFAFGDVLEIISDFKNYKDYEHYGEEINDYIMQCMKRGEHQLTVNNYSEYLNREFRNITEYDYEAIFD